MKGNKTTFGAMQTITLTTTVISTTTGDVVSDVYETYGYKTALFTNAMGTCNTSGIVVYADISTDTGLTYGLAATINYYAVTTAATTRARAYALTNLGTHLRIRSREIQNTSCTVAHVTQVLLKP